MKWKSAELRSLFAPLVLTPQQYYDDRRNDIAIRPIKRLMLAVLEDALCCLNKHANAHNGEFRLAYRETVQWFYSEDEKVLFSFNVICQTLGIEPKYLRSGLRRWREMQSSDLNQRRVGRRSPATRDRSISSGVTIRRVG
jgi:hypothetical protein